MTIDPHAIKEIFTSIGQYIVFPLLVGVFISVYNFIVKLIKSRKFHSIKFNSEKALKISILLSELRTKLNADRAFLSMFHNGDRYIDGSPIIKLSKMSEVCGPGISSSEEAYRSIFISMIPEKIVPLLDKKPHKITIDNLSDCKFKHILMSHGVSQTIEMAILKDKDITGILGVDYCENIDENADLKVLEYYSVLISEVLFNN